MGPRRTWYEILQVDRRAEPEVVEAAYRRLARKYHPDVSRAATAEGRMKEINAAYAVLRDPQQRAAYDRELRAQTEAVERNHRDTAAQDMEHGDGVEEGLLACRQHPSIASVGACGECGAGLCGVCFDRFEPATCPACLLGWASQRRWEILLPDIWFFGILAVAVWICLQLPGMAPDRRLHWSWVGWTMLVAYVVASLPSGWRVVGGDHDDDSFGPVLAFAVVLGAVIAPFRMLKVFWDMGQVRRLEALARSAD